MKTEEEQVADLTYQLQIALMFTLNEHLITNALEAWGEVDHQQGIPVWTLEPDDCDAFCESTDFALCERKYGRFNIVAHELFRVFAKPRRSSV